MGNRPDAALNDLVNAIEKIGVHDHLCLIYETQEEQFSAVIPFMQIGLERGEKCLYVVDDNTAATVIKAMREAGTDVKSAIKSGELAIVSKQESYLKQGYFDPDWMIGFLKSATEEAKSAGFSALRVTGEMTWVLGEDPGTERLMEYEAKLNYFLPKNEALAICQYNRDFFPPRIIKDVISTHPTVICGGMVCRNFYYVPPDNFLGEEPPDKEIDRLLANIKNREKVEEELWERTRELERRNHELEQMNKAFLGRELKMVELKKRINELEIKSEASGDYGARQ
ncbi:MAG: MEDS domain-containing protein [Desulfuromonadaceae bacterium]|nr:MEDS domain-containing protein [Desulfuromonadaceae bacterium]